jgi:tyrosyl-tRNA synthetase
MPILPGTDGVRKMSKSYGNHVGVTDPPEEMFGKLMSIPDDVMGEYFLLLLDEHADPGRHPAEAKRELARRLTDRFHGDGAGESAESRFDQIHVRREVPAEIPEVTVDGTVHLPALIAEQFGVTTSEARRLLGQGGVRLDGASLADEPLDLPAAELAGKVLQIGKRRFVRIVG